MIHFRRVADDNDVPTERGTYRRIDLYWAKYHMVGNRRFWAEVCCPGCGKVGMVGDNHVVHDDGRVHPSDVCPYPPCTFHDWIFLDDWARPVTPRREEP